MNNNRRTGKIAQFKQKVEALTKSMQTFCIRPNAATFIEICACDSIKRSEGDDFTAWRRACLFKYGSGWFKLLGLGGKYPFEPEDLAAIKDAEKTHVAFMMYDAILCKKAIDQPNQSSYLKVLHLFYATGELKYIDLFYQGMGHDGLALSTRRYLANVYNVTKELYQAEVINLGSDHIKNLGLSPIVIDFSYFDDVKQNALKEKARLKELRDLLGDSGNI